MLTVSGRGARGAWHGGCCVIIWMTVIILSMSYMTSCVHIHSKPYMTSFDSQNLSQNLHLHYVHKGQNLHIIYYVQIRHSFHVFLFFSQSLPLPAQDALHLVQVSNSLWQVGFNSDICHQIEPMQWSKREVEIHISWFYPVAGNLPRTSCTAE